MKLITKKCKITVSAFLALWLAAGVLLAAETKLINATDDPGKWRGASKLLSIVADPDPPKGKSALKINVSNKTHNATTSIRLRADASWNDYDGISFWAKGDGSANFACVKFQTPVRGTMWVSNFPLKDKTWHEVKLAWRDFVPYRSILAEMKDADVSKPSKITLIAFGKSWNFNTNHKKPEITFSLSELKLEKGIKPHRPRTPIDQFAPVDAVAKKLKAGEEVTILALGDSITWGTNMKGGNAGSYPAYLGTMLAKHYKNDKVKIVSRAIGGSTTSKGRQWLHRDVTAIGVKADLITVMFGYNEMPKTGEEEKYTKAFVKNIVTYVEEAAGTMKVKPSCILIATIPGRGGIGWTKLDPYAEGIRAFGREHTNIGVADAHGHFKPLGKEKYKPYMSDGAHPSTKGHIEMAKVIFKTITGVDAPE